MLFLIFITGLQADTVPPPATAETAVVQTLGFVIRREWPVREGSPATFIVHGGPCLAYIWKPGSAGGAGAGVELSGEMRFYTGGGHRGPFAGAYLGAGILWRLEDGMNREALTAGVKAGWLFRVESGSFLPDIEPYAAAGFAFLDIGDEPSGELDPAVYLGIRTVF